MQQRPKKIIFVAMWIIGLTIGLNAYIDAAINTANSGFNENSQLNPMESTNPNSPDELFEGNSPAYENYNSSSTSYYYYCGGIPFYYSLCWLYTVSKSNNFDLYLYFDSAFSDLVGTSNATNQLDWIVYRIPYLTVLYPRVYTFTGSGDAYIQYEFGVDLTVNSSRSVSLDSAEYAEIQQIALSSLTTYTIFLEIPTGSDYDLFIFRTPSGSAERYDSHNSTSTNTGQYERIVFTPLYNDTYAIVITKNLGEGAVTLTVYDYIYFPSSNEVTAFELFPILLAFATVIFLHLMMFKRRYFAS